MATLAECNDVVINELQKRGEIIYNPVEKSMKDNSGRLLVYVKGRKFRSPDFICGIGIKEKDGTVSILPEAMGDLRGIKGWKMEDLGICDPVLHYANNDPENYPLKCTEEKQEPPKFFKATAAVDISMSHEKKIALVMTKADLETIISTMNWAETNGNFGAGPQRILEKLTEANQTPGWK